VYDLDLPEFPFVIDLYEFHVYVAEYERNHTLSEEEYKEWYRFSIDIISRTLDIPKARIYFKARKNITDRKEQYTKLSELGTEIIVKEAGLKFILNLTDYLDTGLFLDHRITRGMVMAQAKEKKVLNLFAYTGSFSVYAAAGGASEVTTIDLSKTYTEWAKRNMELNGFEDPKKYFYIQGDVFQNIKALQLNYFDIIILDPPTFSNSKKMSASLDIQRDHWWLINDCLKLLAHDGKLYFSTNHSRFKMYTDKVEAIKIKDITGQTKDFDFERKLKRYCFLIEK